jgi:hypothetical protein
MTDLLNEFITDILSLGEAVKKKQLQPGESQDYPGFFHRGSGYYSKAREGGVVTHKTDNGKMRPLTPQEKTKKNQGKKPSNAPVKTPARTSQTPVTNTTTQAKPKSSDSQVSTSLAGASKNLPGAKGILDAIVGVTEKGSAGAGTIASRAAEASVVLVINDLLEKRKLSAQEVSIDEFMSQNDESIDAVVRALVDLPNSAINDTWFNPIKRQVVGTMSEIEKRFGKISDVVWDNKAGRDEFGIVKEEGSDRSDLYVRLENGEVIGVSLKKDGNVFLANQGYAKIMRTISEFAKSDSAKQNIKNLQSLHESEADKVLQDIVDYTRKNKTSVAERLQQLQRTDIKTVESKYDTYFDPKTNTIRPEIIESILSGDLAGDKVKLLTKSLGVLAKSDSTIESLMTNLRQVDNMVTHKLIDLMNTDPEMNETVKSYMLHVLDMPQMLSAKPFPGVSRVVTVYGAGNVDAEGNTTALFVDGSTLRDTFKFDEGLSQEEMAKQLSDKFIIDAEKDSRVGYIRLKIKNPEYPPPPLYFYPTIASLGVRARGLGSAGVFELYQQSAWTFTLASKNPNPATWTPAQRKAHAKDTLKFLNRQLNNENLTTEEKLEIQKDIDFYTEIQ